MIHRVRDQEKRVSEAPLVKIEKICQFQEHFSVYKKILHLTFRFFKFLIGILYSAPATEQVKGVEGCRISGSLAHDSVVTTGENL